jgi:hypothetical protein
MDQEAFARAVAAHQAGDFETARRGYEPFLGTVNGRRNLGILYSQHGHYGDAERLLRSILEQYPADETTRFSLAMALLGAGRYAEGWPLYEARRRVNNPMIVEPQTTAPEWRGEPIAGQRLVVCGEQGFGDQIQFARYVPMLRETGAEVVFATRPVLTRLFAGSGLAVAPFGPQRPSIPPCDRWVFLCSLPLLLGAREPAALAPLAPPWRGGGGGGGGIGVMPTGSAADHRSLPADAAARLLGMGRDLRPEATGARDFRDTAEIIAGLDLVISIDTSAAHLAAALGAPTWILLPDYAADWRWGRGRDDSVWYPGARLFRQPRPGDWPAVLDAVQTALERRTA